MKFNPKFITAFIIQSNYGQGWEDETEESTYKDAKAQLKCYRENSQYPCRLIRRKAKNPDYIPNALTKKQAEEQFRHEFLPNLDKTDKPLLSFEWCAFVDYLQRTRRISMQQCQNWGHPSYFR